MQTIINEVPTIMVYFAPGLIFFAILKHLINAKFEKQLYELIFSVIISVVIKSGLSFIHCFIFRNYHPSTEIAFFFCAGTGFFAAVIVSRFYRSNRFAKLFSYVFIKSLRSTIWEDCIDFSGGSRVILTTKSNEVISGRFREIEEKEDASWLAIDNHDYNKNVPAGTIDPKYDNILILRLSDVSSVQVIKDSIT